MGLAQNFRDMTEQGATHRPHRRKVTPMLPILTDKIPPASFHPTDLDRYGGFTPHQNLQFFANLEKATPHHIVAESMGHTSPHPTLDRMVPPMFMFAVHRGHLDPSQKIGTHT
jgi:hypothetical protein